MTDRWRHLCVAAWLQTIPGPECSDAPSRQSARRWPRNALSGVAGRDAKERGCEPANRTLGTTEERLRQALPSARDGHKIGVFLDQERTEMCPVCTRLDRKVAVSRGLRRDENGRARAKPWRSLLLLDDAASNTGPRAASGVGLVVVGHGVNHQRSAAGVK